MFTPITPGEAFDKLFQTVERFIEMGLCWKCAIVMASDKTGVHRDRVEDVWVRRQAELAAES